MCVCHLVCKTDSNPLIVADLTFNDMSFLKTSTRHEPTPPPMTMHSRQKDHSRRARERQQLSSFFAPKNQAHPRRHHPISPDIVNNRRLDDMRIWVPTETSAHDKANGRQSSGRENSSGALDRKDATRSSCSPRSHIYHSKRRCTSESSQSSWPHTAYSPSGLETQHSFKPNDDSIGSPPPDHIRTALRETGVYDSFRDRQRGSRELSESRRHARVRHNGLSNLAKRRRYKDHATMVTPKIETSAAPQQVGRSNEVTQATPIADGENVTPESGEKDEQVEDTRRDSSHHGSPMHKNTSGEKKAQGATDRRQQAAEARVPVYAHHGCQTVDGEPLPEAHGTVWSDGYTVEPASHSRTRSGNNLSTFLPQEANSGEQHEVYNMSHPYLQGGSEYRESTLQGNWQDRALSVISRPRPTPDPYRYRIPGATGHTASVSTNAYSWVPCRPASNTTSIPEHPALFRQSTEMRESRLARSWKDGGGVLVEDDSEPLDEYIRRVEQEVLGKETPTMRLFAGDRNTRSFEVPRTEEPVLRSLRLHGNVGTRPSSEPSGRDARRVRFEMPAVENDALGGYDFEPSFSPVKAEGTMQQPCVDFNGSTPTIPTAREAETWNHSYWHEARPTGDEDVERAEMANFWGGSRLQQF